MATEKHIALLCREEDGAQALLSALHSLGLRAFQGEEALSSAAMAAAVLSRQALSSGVVHHAFCKAVCSGLPVACALHPDAQLTPALRWHVQNMPTLPLGPAQQMARAIALLPGAQQCMGGKNAPYILLCVRTGERVPLLHDGFCVGRSAEKCDYVPRGDGSVSRVHAVFTLAPGRAGITDQFSMNGVLVNGVRLEPGEMCEIEPDDEIMIGQEKYLLLPGEGGDGE